MFLYYLMVTPEFTLPLTGWLQNQREKPEWVLRRCCEMAPLDLLTSAAQINHADITNCVTLKQRKGI